MNVLKDQKPNANDAMSDQEMRALICELCRNFYALGWVSGTGGGISMRKGDDIYMAPSGVQKERIAPEDIFILDPDGNVVYAPDKPLKVSACKPLFMHAYHKRGAGAVIHSHSINAMLATLLYPEGVFRIANLEMLKGIQGVGAFDLHEVPIIPNTPHEAELTDSLGEAIDAYPKSHAVLVEGHGVYVWGRDWVQAKTQSECYDYIFESAVRIKQLGLDPVRGGLQR